MAKKSNFRKEKFKEVLHYIINEVGGKPNVGKVVLYKLLYFSDFNFFEIYEKHLTGEEYRKIQMGPAPCHFDEVIKDLEKEEKIKMIKDDFYSHKQNKFISIKKPNLELLSANEIKVIDDVLVKYGDLNAKKISEISHIDMPWQATEDKDIIDYRLVFYRETPLSVEQDE